ncbi:MAG TPA: ABC transporter substrate-binding protein [Chloroflexota bacterium]|nr:ABC transporter substrate-binding protein [Chloroflexota bacterium]
MPEPSRLAHVLALLALAPALALAACAPTPAPTRPPAAPAPPPEAPPAPAAAPAPATPAGSAVPPLSPPVAVKTGSTGLVGDSGFFAALARGYFQEEGLDVELVPLRSSTDALPALAVGELDFASSSVDGSLLNALARDITFRIVGFNAIIPPTDTTGGMVVRQDHVDSGRYRDPKDLRGMTLGLSAPGGLGQVWTERVLAMGGLSLDDVQFTTLSFPDTPVALANKAIDAAYLVEPFISVAETQGAAKAVMLNGEIYPGLVAQVQLLSPVFAERQPEAARRYVTAWLRGQRDFYHTFVKNEGGREEFYQVLQQYTPIKDARLYPRMTTHLIDVNSEMDPTTLNELQDYYLRYGTQLQRVDLSKVIDRSYGQYAVERLGRITP